MKIVIASSNIHKIREYRQLLKIFDDLDVYSLLDFPSYIPPEETGKTFEENAVLKASHAAKELNLWTMSDDSGLVVPALDGAPGVYSARYAGLNRSDSDCRQKLLKEMEHLEELKRAAYFTCWIAIASPNKIEKTVHANVEGVILTEERGNNGFGYDSLFQKYDYDKTFAELDEPLKNKVSHRAKAFDQLVIALESLKAKDALPN